ncbi:MAG: septal ring lytic transglycosylase RlpA family protein [Burkholderiales bacterium]
MTIRFATPLLALLLATFSAFAHEAPEQVPQGLIHSIADDAVSGTAAWYGGKFNGRKTASGQRFNASALTAAHATLPFGTRVRVTNLKNKRSVVVTINDRLSSSAGRVIDVSRGAAQRLGFVKAGLADVRLEPIGRASARAGRR